MVAAVAEDLVPNTAPDEIKKRVLEEPRTPIFRADLGIPVDLGAEGGQGQPRHRLVVIGDSLSHGFQSGAVFNTDLSYPATIAYELGWFDEFRFPRYPGAGGLPLNLELLLRRLEDRFGPEISGWEVPLAVFEAQEALDKIEDYWERGGGGAAPQVAAINHCLAMYGWNLRDALTRTASSCQAAIGQPRDHVLWRQLVENASERAALRVYPHWTDATSDMTLFQAATALGEEHDEHVDHGIETLIVFLGSNNALQTVTQLKVVWSGQQFRDPVEAARYTVWRPEHFQTELADVVAAVRAIKARHVIWCTVPHVTIAPIAKGIGDKVRPGSRYFPHYARPWVSPAEFSPTTCKCLTDKDARAIDTAIDMYNDAITDAVRSARLGDGGDQPRDWYLLDIAGLLDRLANRRYISDPNARPSWWTPYSLPPRLAGLSPAPDSQYLLSDGRGGRAQGGLFSLDGVHPTTVGYGIIAQEMINVMRRAGVEFRFADGSVRPDPVLVDFERLIRLDTLVQRPPQNLRSSLDLLGWADEKFGWVLRSLGVGVG